jgi:hypothetical protein
MIRTLETVD